MKHLNTPDEQIHTPPVKLRGAPRSKKSHAAILAAALELAENGGPEALSTEAVARLAGVGKQTIYRWWPTRIELFIEVYNNYNPPLGDKNASAPLRDVLDKLFTLYRNGPSGELLAAMIAQSHSDSKAAALFQTRFRIPRRDALAHYLVLSGECEPDFARDTADLVAAMIWYALLNEPDRLDATYIERICALIEGRRPSPLSQKPHFVLKDGYRSGYAGALIKLHMNYYAPIWGFGRNFEMLITRDLGLLLDRYDSTRDQLLRLENTDEDIKGTLVVEGGGGKNAVHLEGWARIRFFVISPSAQGQGLGRKMLKHALETCRLRGQTKLFLTTFKGLDAAESLYKRAGFKVTAESENNDWNEGSRELRYALDLDAIEQ